MTGLVALADVGSESAAAPAQGAFKARRAAADVRKKSAVSNSPQGESWDSIKQLPDWGGVWGVPVGRTAPPTPPSLTPAYAARLAAYKEAQTRGEQTQSEHANCLPFAYPSSMGIYPVEFLFTPGKVTVAIETDSQMRRIFTDGRPVPDDPDLTFQGYSVGHWEGDTLVAETVGLVPSPQMEIMAGVGHSDQLRIRERIHLTAPDKLEVEWTYLDPAVLTEPWVVRRVYDRHRDWDLQEYNCAQNNRDAADEKGRPSMKLEQ